MPAAPSLSRRVNGRELYATFESTWKTTTEIQSTPTCLVSQSSNFPSTPGNHHKLYSFLNPNKQQPLFNEQQLRRRSNTSQQKDKLMIVINFPQSILRSARIAPYSIMQQLFLPEFRYLKGSITPEDSTSNLPAESSSKLIKKKSHLLSLSIFFDEDNNVIRVGGLLANSPYSLDKKFPIIIPKTYALAELLIQKCHLKTSTDDLFALWQTVWIPGGIAKVKKVSHNCKPCIRFDTLTRQLLMVDLLAEQIVEFFAFHFTRMAYCGPFYTEDSSQKLKKSYADFLFLSPQRNYT